MLLELPESKDLGSSDSQGLVQLCSICLVIVSLFPDVGSGPTGTGVYRRQLASNTEGHF